MSVLQQSVSGTRKPYYDFHHTVDEDEIDAQGHVNNLRYIQWTLWAAGAHSTANGWDSNAALERGLGWVVRHHDAKYRASALSGDEIVVRTWVSDVTHFATMRRYAICRTADRKVLATVKTRWVFVDLNVRKAVAIPPEAIAKVEVCDPPPPLPWNQHGERK